MFIGWKMFSVRKCTWCVTVSVWERWLLSLHTITGKKRHRCVEKHLKPWHFGSLCNLKSHVHNHTYKLSQSDAQTLASTCISQTHKSSIRIITTKRFHNETLTITFMHTITQILSQSDVHNLTFTYMHNHKHTFTIRCSHWHAHHHFHNEILTIVQTLTGTSKKIRIWWKVFK